MGVYVYGCIRVYTCHTSGAEVDAEIKLDI